MNRTALIVIDMQVGLFNEKLSPRIHEGEALLSATRRLIAAARESKSSVVFIQHCALLGGPLAKGTDSWKIHPELEPGESDPVVLKHQSNAFEGTELASVLRQRNIETVVTCGLQSEFCVSNTSLSALEHGFEVIVARDCHSTVPTNELTAEAIIERQNDVFERKGAGVLTVEELIETVLH